MFILLPFNTEIAKNVKETTMVRGADSISILSAKSDIIITCGNTEFSKMYVIPDRCMFQNRVLNYRISIEVMKLLLSSIQIDWKAANADQYLVVEEVVTPDVAEVQLMVYLQILEPKQVNAWMVKNKPAAIMTADSELSRGVKQRFIVASGIEYDIETKLGWYTSFKDRKVRKALIDMGLAFKQMVEVSNLFKTGICVENNLAYADSSKTGIEVYRTLKYSGEPMLISHSCIQTLNEFTKGNEDAYLRLFRYREYMLAANTNDVVLVWKNVKFNLEPNLDDLKAAPYRAIYETDTDTIGEICRGISVNKASRIFCNIDFERNRMILRDTNKGVYEFRVPFICHRGGGKIGESVSVNYRTLKSLMTLKSGYNKTRFFLYDRFIRIDFINYFEEGEEGEEEGIYDGDDKMITVMGKGE